MDLRADVLKAGHYGSRTATSAAFLDAVRPSTMVVMCGWGNSYGHPHKEFLELVGQPERNIALLRTDESGTIVIATDGREIKVHIIEIRRDLAAASGGSSLRLHGALSPPALRLSGAYAGGSFFILERNAI
jgi:hypothetical protein